MTSSSSAGATVFVTVGTTKFDVLIRAVDTQAFASSLLRKGYTRLLVQRGNGSYVPSNLLGPGVSSGATASGLYIEFFDYSPSLAAITASAALVISHAGAGSIFETLTAGKPLIVMPNAMLMDNHQVELGETLARMQHLVCATPDSLPAAVDNLDPSCLLPYQKGNVDGIIKQIDELMGY